MTRILGIEFFDDSIERLLAAAGQGGLFVFPSGPGMACDLLRSSAYRMALEESDFVVADSSLMVMAHNLVSRNRMERLSGLRFLRAMIEGGFLKVPGSAFWVMATKDDREHHLRWLNGHGAPASTDYTYVAPRYGPGPIEEPELLERLEQLRPAWVIIAIGGGTQERLGHFLRRNLSFRPAIICIGAAISFMTGLQANIPPWADRFYLGWLARCLQSPSTYVPRYWHSCHLPWLIWKYRDRMPPLKGS